MKIAIVNVNEAITAHGGVRIQGVMWAEGLRKLGHVCDLVDFWQNYDWKSYDAVIVLGYGGFVRNFCRGIRPICKKLVLAPIIDPTCSTKVFKFFTKYWGAHKRTGLTTKYHDLYLAAKECDLFLARSEFEALYIHKCLEVEKEKIKLVPLSIRTNILNELPKKENFVLHVSRLASENKNVQRLIQSAIKFDIPLKLAGFLNGKEEEKWLFDLIGSHKNIEYLGVLSDSELETWYKRAKVFALPSTNEGVGMVALEAAGYGCEIVLTNLGAPKEYFDGMARLVNPYSIDDIGYAMRTSLAEGFSQPKLLRFVATHYSLESCSNLLINVLK
ncbi:MAG: glycosyltransferase family 4 protein [Prevotellaceae bacterium]